MADLKSEKDVWMNKLRQVNPHWKPSENKELNEYYNKTWSNAQEVMAQQIDEELEEGIKEMVDKHQEDLDKAGAEGSKKFWPITTHEFRPQEIEENRKMNPSKYTEDELEQAKELITNKIVKHFDDVLFEMVCQEMGDNYLFQSDNYLTEAGYDMFEDEWFEFYHEHHGDILYRVRHNLFE